ncbi:protein of unknown function [Magnetospira sp. QH-2]|nr:protein of unknown function [Magnetospira sp. QH-2]
MVLKSHDSNYAITNYAELRRQSIKYCHLPFEMTADWDHGNHHGPIQDVSFCVYGPHPDEVSSFWGLPTRALVKGTTSVSKVTGKTRVQRVNAWLLGYGVVTVTLRVTVTVTVTLY